MDFFPTIWNVLHDRSITKITGVVPGTIRIDVEIIYLRERFKDPGETIQITLTDCTRFAYRDYEDKDLNKDFITDPPTIAATELEILSAEMVNGFARVTCASRKGQGGELEVAAVDGSLTLDSGRAITLEQLIQVADEYWEDFRTRSKTSHPR